MTNINRLLELAGIQLCERGEVTTSDNRSSSRKGADRRAVNRSTIEPALNAFRDHMFKIKRALDSGNLTAANKLVDGAIRAFSQKL